LRKLVNAQDTAIGRKARALENKVLVEVMRIFKKRIQPNLGITPVESMKNGRVGDIIHDLVRARVEEGYKFGIEQVADFVREPYLKISNKDYNNINEFSKEIESQFWLTIQRLADREKGYQLAAADPNEDISGLEKKKPFDFFAALTGFASLLGFTAINRAVASKTEELAPVVSNLPVEEGVDRFGPKFYPVSDRLISGSKDPFILVFFTASDAKVDEKICQPLHRREFSFDDPDIPDPPLHRFCRCILIPKNTITNDLLL